MISEFLTDEQMRLMVVDAERELEEARGQVIVNPVQVDVGELDGTRRLVEQEKEKIRGLGVELVERNRVEIEEKLLAMRPPPLRNAQAKEVIKRAIDELLE
jgi:hypothetical protein